MDRRAACRIETADAVRVSMQKWNDAPMHVKALADVFVRPLLAALVAVNAELEELKKGGDDGSS